MIEARGRFSCKRILKELLYQFQMSKDAARSGIAEETAQSRMMGRGMKRMMKEGEAREILDVSVNSSWEDVLQKYNTMFENNAKSGSFYLQSKVHRAKECLEHHYKMKQQQ